MKDKCKVCSKETIKIINFDKMPIANGFLNKITKDEFFYNLSVDLCPECFMIQLGETVKPEVMFNDKYHFISSTSSVMRDHFGKISSEILKSVSIKNNPFIVELGCNDGIMLRNIASKGIKHLGIEPSTNVASLAKQSGVEVLEDFFNEFTATKIAENIGQADIICGSNVFCHIEDINSVFKGISILLKQDGILFFEDPYMLDIVKKSSFDQIYDEHVYYFCGLSISNLAKIHGMQLVNMQHQDVHGGSMRYYIKKGTKNKISENVARYLVEERQLKLNKIEGYIDFNERVTEICIDLKETLKKLKKEGNKIVGYGATSKSTTLLNYAQIGPELLDYICDTTPTKINKYSPGMHIPIKSHEAFMVDKPPYALLLAWNHKKEILDKEKGYRNNGGKFITYFPNVNVE